MEGESGCLSEIFMEDDGGASTTDDILSVVEAWELMSSCDFDNLQPPAGITTTTNGSSSSSSTFEFKQSETEVVPSCKRQKLLNSAAAVEERTSHITVERNRRKQMNEHLAVLRTLMPCFYVKRGDQASIIGGVVDYINELQQVLHSLESKKQRKAAYNEVVLSPRFASSPRLKPPLSPRLSLPVSPRTPQSSGPYKPTWGYLNSPSLPSPVDPSPCNSSASSSINDAVNELVATSKSSVAQVEVNFSGPNLLLNTASHRIPGQLVKIVSALQQLALEILHITITTLDETMLYAFTIKIGIECQLSAEDLAQQIQQTFCSNN